MKRQIAYAAMVIGLLLVAYNVADRVEQHTEAKIATARAEAMEGCWPAAGETAVIVSNGRQARCQIHTTRSLSPGFAPKLVSAAVVEVTP